MPLVSDGMPVYITTFEKKQFRLIRDWQYQQPKGLIEINYFVPKGYVCDLASIPKFIWWWQWGAQNAAAIAHDYIYEHGYILVTDSVREKFKLKLSRAAADLLFLEILEAVGVSFISRTLMFWAVRFFGRGVWTQEQK